MNGLVVSSVETLTLAARKGGAGPTWWMSPWLLVPLLVLIVFASRVPAAYRSDELNPDESQMLAQAIRYQRDIVPWRSVDGTTSGPLNSWLLLGAHRFGMPLSHTGAHSLSALILATIVVLTYTTLRQLADGVVSAGGAIAAMLFVVVAQEDNFTHYSSALLPALLSAVGMQCVAWRRQSFTSVCLTGVAAGMLPWAKLQAAPLAAIFLAWIAWRILWSAEARSVALGRRVTSLALVFLFACLPSLMILGLVASGGALRDFWMSYVVANAAYATGASADLTAKIEALTTSWQSSALLDGVLVFSVVCAFACWRKWRMADPRVRGFVILSSSLAGAAVFAVLAPRFSFEHQQWLLFQPLCLVSGGVLTLWLGSPGSRTMGSRRFVLFFFMLCLFLIPMTRLPAAVAQGSQTYKLRFKAADKASARVAATIRLVCPEAQSMAIWGWSPALHIQTGIAPATRHAICHFLIDPTPSREFLRESFLADVRRERPALVVDTIADGMWRWFWNPSHRVSSFPGLDSYLRDHYTVVFEQHLIEGGEPVRFYLSHEAGQRMEPSLGTNLLP